MTRVFYPSILLAVLYVFLAPSTSSGEPNLWISYYYASEENFYVGEFRDSNTLINAAIEEEKALQNKEPHRWVNTLRQQGMSLMALENYEQAEKCLREAEEFTKTHLGKQSRWLPSILNSLGDLYYIAGKKDQAEKIYRESLQLNERDQYNIEVCRALNGMALLQHDANALTEAEELLKRAIMIHEKASRRLHPYCATAYTNLGILLTKLQRYTEAEAALKQASYIHSKTLPQNHPDVALRIEAEAALLVNMGCSDKARDLQKKAEEIREHVNAHNPKITS